MFPHIYALEYICQYTLQRMQPLYTLPRMWLFYALNRIPPAAVQELSTL
jgi:hypothetical protein